MSPSLEKYVYKAVKAQPDDIGDVTIQPLQVDSLIATRPFLNETRLFRIKRKRAAPSRPEVISTGDEYFVVDGHHKARRAFPGSLIECRVLQTNHAGLGAVLERRKAGLIQELPIRQYPIEENL